MIGEMGVLTYSAKLSYILNLSNGIIGVSVLAMPFCMKQCGLLFGALVLFGSSLLTRLSCNLLIKGAYFSRTNSYESFALQAYGRPGKLAVEISLILYSKGTLIAFFVVIGDLAPLLFSDLAGIFVGDAATKTAEYNGTIRIMFMTAIAFLIILPLSMLRTMASLSRISSLAIVFYGFLVARIVVQSLPALFLTTWWKQVTWWQPSGFFQTLPIFALSLSCQTQLFVMASEIPDCTPAKMDNIVGSALNLCCSIYFLVGTFGYIAFHHRPIGGDILVLLENDGLTKLIKAGFLLSLAVSYPIMIFPCRAAIYSMIFKPKVVSLASSEMGIDHMQPSALKAITIYLIAFNLLVAIWVPDVEMILSLSGSLVGSLICFVLPGLLFCRVCPSQQPFMRLLAKICIAVGIFTLIFSTYVSLREADSLESHANVNRNLDTVGTPERGARLQPAQEKVVPKEAVAPAQKGVPAPVLPNVPQLDQHHAKRQVEMQQRQVEIEQRQVGIQEHQGDGGDQPVKTEPLSSARSDDLLTTKLVPAGISGGQSKGNESKTVHNSKEPKTPIRDP